MKAPAHLPAIDRQIRQPKGNKLHTSGTQRLQTNFALGFPNILLEGHAS
ncbi:MAG: hypothetical protein NC911_05045 [Candidatus Omnitrophica bacterium]|nr:hypothetical protein [Candidatus Omnitrophota bacterium]